MIKRLSTLLCIALALFGCTTTETIKKPLYEPFLRSKPLDDASLTAIRTTSPKDAVFADLLQAFALMRSADLTQKSVQKNILGLLGSSVQSFEDMDDPVNFSIAFSADEDKPYRGWPHERMFSATIAAVFLMADNKCAQALPYLRNAEFLDARFQKMPFGTDAPLIYALTYRCLHEQNVDAHALQRAQEGVFRSVRFLTLQEPLIKALIDMATVDMRAHAVSNRLAYMLYEISLYHSLMTAKDHASIDELLSDAAYNATLFSGALHSHFADEHKARIRPLISELAKVLGMNKNSGFQALEELIFFQVSAQTKAISEKLQLAFRSLPSYKKSAHEAMLKTTELTNSILKAARADKMALSFLGQGPTIVRTGSYQEASIIHPGPDAHTSPTIRERNLTLKTDCGFHRLKDGGFSVVLCRKNQVESSQAVTMPSLELLSLSRKATTAQGRTFVEVLKGRAQLRAVTEQISEVSRWSAFFLFYLGATMMDECNRRGEGEACYTKGLVVWGIATITVAFSGLAWLAGRIKNPAADSRYIHLMYESAYVSI